MKTIRTKFFLVFMVLILSLTLGGIFLNSLLLEPYYMSKNKDMLVNTSKLIQEQYSSDKDNIDSFINTEARSYGINIFIIDSDSNIVYGSSDLKNSQIKKLITNRITSCPENKNPVHRRNVEYIQKGNNNEDETKLMYTTNLGDGHSLILIKYVKSIQDSVKIANEFYILAGTFIFLAGSIFVLFFSRKITKPIIEMSNVAENISNLNFDEVVDIKSKDELGTLAQSINKISHKLNKSLNDLKNDLERRKILVRNMSHELKTPIGIIKGYSEGMKYGLANNKEKMDKYCSILVDECDRMDKLVKELLDYSMMDDGLVNLNISNFDISEFLSYTSNRFKLMFEQNNINFTLNCNNHCVINADREMLEKALSNFITNAIKYGDSEKIISITSRLVDDNKIKISVFNSGSNIPEDEVNKIWDVCYKVDKARSRELGGHGIGLSLVKLIAQLHNGTCSVENIEKGVIFSLEIPISYNESSYCEK
ncbi:MAG: HAMP domain-containing sensor histidine kinase [Clostridium sp.]|nr:HAMP domain-containing sensor histidine kinase [Clostridium sp.]